MGRATSTVRSLSRLRGRAGVGAAAREVLEKIAGTFSSGTRGESPTRLASLGTLPRKREREYYAEAVVTPPSTTMVWPVMKVEASEAR